jgi:pilus assembly protein CpaC
MTIPLLAAALLSTMLPQTESPSAQEPAASAAETPATQELSTPGAAISLLVGRSQLIAAPWQVKGVSLTDPKVADVQIASPERILVSGLAVGSTDLYLWSDRGEVISHHVQIGIDLTPLRAELASVFPTARLDLIQQGSVLAVSGVLENAEQAQQLKLWFEAAGLQYVDLTVVPGVQQVQVMVRVAEVSRTGIRALGVNGFMSGNDAFLGSTIGPSGGPLNPISIGPPDGAPASGDTPFTFNQEVGVSPAVTLFAGVPSSDLEIFVQALVENQYLRLLAEPNLVALSGEEASFLAGGEFPIPVVQGGGTIGSTSITIEYKEFGVALKFRPVVLGDGKIRLSVNSEVSDLSDIGAIEIQGFRVPAVVTRRALTTLELSSGQTFAMAGLLSQNITAQVARTPLLSSLPILGSLFRSTRYKRGETELLVLVTALLVEPVNQTVFPPLPGSEHIVPSDWELYSLGRLEGGPPPRLSTQDAEWLKSKGLDRLNGPGAWSTHESSIPLAGTDYKPAATKPADPSSR